MSLRCDPVRGSNRARGLGALQLLAVRASRCGYALRGALGLHVHKWQRAARGLPVRVAEGGPPLLQGLRIFPFFLSDWGGQQHYVVNVACLEGVDPYEQETTLIDGKSF